MAASSRRLAGLTLLALPILLLAGLFAWAGATSSLAAEGADSPTGIARAFIADVNAGDCPAALRLVSSSPLHVQTPTCNGFTANSVTISSCNYSLGALPKGEPRVLPGFDNLVAVYAKCVASSSVTTTPSIPIQIVFLTAVSSSTGSLQILDVR